MDLRPFPTNIDISNDYVLWKTYFGDYDIGYAVDTLGWFTTHMCQVYVHVHIIQRLTFSQVQWPPVILVCVMKPLFPGHDITMNTISTMSWYTKMS